MLGLSPKRTATVVAKTECELFCLCSKDVLLTFRPYPEILEHIIEGAREKYKKLQMENPQTLQRSDTRPEKVRLVSAKAWELEKKNSKPHYLDIPLPTTPTDNITPKLNSQNDSSDHSRNETFPFFKLKSVKSALSAMKLQVLDCIYSAIHIYFLSKQLGGCQFFTSKTIFT